MSRVRAFSLVELLVVSAIIGVMIAILLPAIQQVRNSSANTQCVNQMRQLGIALHNYHDAFQHFPANANVSFYVALLPYIDEGDQVDNWQSQGEAPVATFLCPLRRNTDIAGARVDYAGAVSTDENKTILGGRAVKLATVNAQDGSSNTIMVAHKSVRNTLYSGGPNDLTWGNGTGSNTRRTTNRHVRDTFASTSSASTFGAAHPGKSAPVLMADGSIQPLKYGTSSTLLVGFFNYNGKEIDRITDDYAAIEIDYNAPPATPPVVPPVVPPGTTPPGNQPGGPGGSGV